ncbi:PAS domain-containing sensor histidine kinase [Novosphingopyxis baekryungensis]|uniref:PAS domain-containing sensor histidine kinase n=1 Tax=Novosphingopyxis baekryungensis TaxID=279369 RepID=UPI0003B398DA|nr:PAS domain-containing sensor histidine kinase [Novosphingopyxis baekryungensis]
MSRDQSKTGQETGPADLADQAARLREQLAERDEELRTLRRELAQARAEFDSFYQFSPIGLAQFDDEHRHVRVNAALAELNGIPMEDHIGKTPSDIVPGLASQADASIDQVLKTGKAIRHDRVSGFLNEQSTSAHVYDVDWYPVLRDGEVRGVSVLVHDATSAEQHDMFARHMVRELQHRVKNSLANVMALVEQAARSDRPKEQVLSVLKERISALAAIHGKLTERNWESVEFSLLVQQEIGREPRQGRIQADGPEVAVGAQSSLALSMVLHELAANARRHGALSCPDGRLAIHWTIENVPGDEAMYLRWRETGCNGALERGTPGFGTRLIATSVRNALRGELTEEWLEDGLSVHIKLPLSSIAPPEQEFTAGIKRRVSRAF